MVRNFCPKNRKGWIRIIEVFVAILLITGILFVVIRGEYSKQTNLASKTSETEIAILRDIELNNNLRSEILGATPPIEWENFETSMPDTRTRINELIPNYLECEAKLCALEDVCVLDEYTGEDVYAESVVIAADLNTYNPRQLKLFCWGK